MASKPICPQVILVCTEILSSARVLFYRNQNLVLLNKLLEFNQYMSFCIFRNVQIWAQNIFIHNLYLINVGAKFFTVSVRQSLLCFMTSLTGK